MAGMRPFRLPTASNRVPKGPAAKLGVIGTIVALLLGGCASSTGALPAPAVEASATASANAALRPPSFEAIESRRDLNRGPLEALDTVARAMPVQYEGGRAFITLSRDQRFKMGVQLSRPNLVGIGMISRWE